MDLLPGEEATPHPIFAFSAPVPPFEPPDARRRRRRPPAAPRPIDWSDVFERGDPIAVRSSPQVARISAALSDEAWLQAELPHVEVHTSAAQTVQMASAVQPLGGVSGLEWVRPWEERNVSLGTLLRAERCAHPCGGGETSPWLYYFAPLGRLPAGVRAGVGDLSAFSTPFLPLVEANLWAGTPGISSPVHYDLAHNVYMQIKGTKRFILFPPSASHDMYVYPRLHPSTRQSQVDLRSYDIDRFPHFKKWANATSPRLGTRPLETVLSPGDILYLPPYYWHRASVVGNETAISIGVYTQSLPLTAYPLFKQHGLPWPPHAGVGERIATFREYAIAIAAQLPPSLGQSHVRAGGFACAVLQRCVCLADADATAEGDGAVRRRLKRWVADRYAAIDDPRVVRGVGELVCRSDAAFARLLPSEAPRLPHSRTAWVRTHARALRSNVQQLPNRGEYFSAEAWELELTSLLEDVAGAAVGAELALQLLEWVVGSPVLTTEKCERELHYDGHISTSID